MKRLRFIAAFMAMIIWCSAVMVYAEEPMEDMTFAAGEEAGVPEEEAVHGEEEAAPEEGESASEDEALALEDEAAVPENDAAAPGDGTIASENDATAPEDEEVLSADGLYEEIYYRKFEDSGNGLIITGLKTAGTINNPVIPSKMKGTIDGDENEYPVVGIEEKAFNGRGNLKGTLTLPDGIQKIGLGAFWGCINLTGTVTIPATVTQLGYHVSDGSEVVVIDPNDPDANDPSGNVFSGCNGITEFVNKTDCLLYLPDLHDPLETFDKYEWVNAADSSIIKNNRIRKGTAVKKEYKTIDQGSFKYRYLDGGKTATVQGLADKLTYADNPAFPATIANNPITGIESFAFQEQKGLAGTLTLPEGITSIGMFAFSGCENLTGSLTIPATVTKIDNGAFYECEGFTGTVTFPAGLTSIGGDAIKGCTGLTKVINNSGCQIDLPSAGEGYKWVNDSGKKINSIGKGTATKIKLEEEGYVSDYFYKAAFNEGGTTLMITGPVDNTKYNPDPVIPKTIDGKAVTKIDGFDHYNGLTGHITFPEGLTGIGYGAFSGCTGLTGTLELPDSLEEIDSYAFKGCAGFTGTVTIPAGVKKIGSIPFEGCDGIEVIENKSGQTVYLPERTGYIWVDKDQKEINQIRNGTATRKRDPQYVTDGTFWAVNYDTNTVQIREFVDKTKAGSEITIPAEIEGKKVESIYNNPFSYCIYLTKLVNNTEIYVGLPERTGYVWVNGKGEEITGIADGTATRKYADGTFDDGSYAAVTNEDGQTATIVGLTYQEKEITNPKIPETIKGKTVTGIAYGAFSFCKGMKGTVTIPATVKNIDNGKITYQGNRDYTVFEGCDGITRFDNRSLRVLELPTIIGKTWVSGEGYEVIDKVRNGSAVRSDIKPKPVPVSSVKITPAEKNMKVKESVTLKAEVAPANAAVKDVTWASGDTSIAEVDQNGKVTAKAVGKVTITATAKDGSGATGKAVINVISDEPTETVPVASVKITPKEKTLNAKKSVKLTANVAPANATNKNVKWASSNTSVAKVDQNGKVTAKAPGKATITATAKDGSGAVGKAVIKVRGISSNTQKLVLKQGATNKRVKVTFVNDVYKKCTKTDKKKVIKSVGFDKKTGKLTIKANKKNGTATVNVKSKGGLTQKITVTVQAKKVTTTKITAKVNGKNIKNNKITLKKKKSTSVTVTATPDKISTGESITAKSTDTKIATVNYDKKTGTYKITAKNKVGTCKVKFTAGKKTKTITVQVKK